MLKWARSLRKRDVFGSFSCDYIVVHQCSGDEIDTLFDSDLTVAQQKIEQVRSTAVEQERTFYCEIGA